MVLRARGTFSRSNSAVGVRRVTFKSVVREVIRDLPTNRVLLRMGSFIRAVMRDEFESTIRPRLELLLRDQFQQLSQLRLVQSPRSWSPNPARLSTSESSQSPFMLRFVNSPDTVYTDTSIEAEDGAQIRIELINIANRTRVVSGPLSLSKVEVVVLDGRFNQDDWSEDEFASNIVQRDYRQPLLKGDLTVYLKEGLGVLGKGVVFTDSSSRSDCGKFRLGARLKHRCSVETKVITARSEAFVVKVSRSKEYRKHHPPSPDDEVFRLEKVSKKGPIRVRLNQKGIHTVKDLRRLHVVDPNMLRTILGDGKQVSEKIWNCITQHAQECKLDDNERYVYNHADGNRLLLNSVYEVLGACFGVSDFKPLAEQTYSEQVMTEKMRLQAYRSLSARAQSTTSCSVSDPPPDAIPELAEHFCQVTCQSNNSALTNRLLSVAQAGKSSASTSQHYLDSMQESLDSKYDDFVFNMPSSVSSSFAHSQLPIPPSLSYTLPFESDPRVSSPLQASTVHNFGVKDRLSCECQFSLPAFDKDITPEAYDAGSSLEGQHGSEDESLHFALPQVSRSLSTCVMGMEEPLGKMLW